MPDNIPGNPPDENKKPDAAATPEEEAHAQKMRELFGDLDEDDTGAPKVDTIESLRAERDELTGQVARMSSTLGRSQQDNLTLSRRVDEAKQLLQRTETNFEQEKKFAAEKFIKDLIPVVDTFELGLAAITKKQREEDPKFDKLAQGMEKSLAQLTAVFNKYGVKQINPLNEAFDAEKHEAITMQEKEGVEPETVIGVAQKGYELNGRVIRNAKVIVTPPQ
ncbi:MAG: nucleotide exchange factor GrpE [Micavibrio sp.]|nr:nucleotide exchange factor GrpE [Micavibrio sp.]